MAGRHCDKSYFNASLLFVSFFLSLFTFFFFSMQQPFNMDGILYYITCFVFAFVLYICSTIIFALVEKFFKGHCSKPTPLSGNEQFWYYNEMVSRLIV